MVCSKGVPLADKAYGPNTAHLAVECSNQGLCDRSKVSLLSLLLFCNVHYVKLSSSFSSSRGYVSAIADFGEMLVKKVSFVYLIELVSMFSCRHKPMSRLVLVSASTRLILSGVHVQRTRQMCQHGLPARLLHVASVLHRLVERRDFNCV